MLYTNYYRCCRLFQTTIENCKVPSLKRTNLNCIQVTTLGIRQIVVMCHIACWFRSGEVLKFDQFYHSSFF